MMNERKGVIPKGACTNETKGPMQGAAQEEQFIRWIFWIVLLTLIPWIVIYPADSVIQPSNNRAQLAIYKRSREVELGATENNIS